MSDKKVFYTISVNKETAEKIEEYAKFLNMRNKLRLIELPFVTHEDIIKGALDSLLTMLERFYEFDKNFNFYSLKPKSKIKNRFEEIAIENGYNQSIISKITGIDQPSISRIMKNKNQPSMDYFIRIWIALDRPPIEDIFFPEDE